jgi:hypothetical protein
MWFVEGINLYLVKNSGTLTCVASDESLYPYIKHLFNNENEIFIIFENGSLSKFSYSKAKIKEIHVSEGFENSIFCCANENFVYTLDNMGFLYSTDLNSQKTFLLKKNLKNVKGMNLSKGKLYISTFE